MSLNGGGGDKDWAWAGANTGQLCIGNCIRVECRGGVWLRGLAPSGKGESTSQQRGGHEAKPAAGIVHM